MSEDGSFDGNSFFAYSDTEWSGYKSDCGLGSLGLHSSLGTVASRRPWETTLPSTYSLYSVYDADSDAPSDTPSHMERLPPRRQGSNITAPKDRLKNRTRSLASWSSTYSNAFSTYATTTPPFPGKKRNAPAPHPVPRAPQPQVPHETTSRPFILSTSDYSYFVPPRGGTANVSGPPTARTQRAPGGDVVKQPQQQPQQQQQQQKQLQQQQQQQQQQKQPQPQQKLQRQPPPPPPLTREMLFDTQSEAAAATLPVEVQLWIDRTGDAPQATQPKQRQTAPVHASASVGKRTASTTSSAWDPSQRTYMVPTAPGVVLREARVTTKYSSSSVTTTHLTEATQEQRGTPTKEQRDTPTKQQRGTPTKEQRGTPTKQEAGSKGMEKNKVTTMPRTASPAWGSMKDFLAQEREENQERKEFTKECADCILARRHLIALLESGLPLPDPLREILPPGFTVQDVDYIDFEAFPIGQLRELFAVGWVNEKDDDRFAAEESVNTSCLSRTSSFASSHLGDSALVKHTSLRSMDDDEDQHSSEFTAPVRPDSPAVMPRQHLFSEMYEKAEHLVAQRKALACPDGTVTARDIIEAQLVEAETHSVLLRQEMDYEVSHNRIMAEIAYMTAVKTQEEFQRRHGAQLRSLVESRPTGSGGTEERTIWLLNEQEELEVERQRRYGEMEMARQKEAKQREERAAAMAAIRKKRTERISMQHVQRAIEAAAAMRRKTVEAPPPPPPPLPCKEATHSKPAAPAPQKPHSRASVAPAPIPVTTIRQQQQQQPTKPQRTEQAAARSSSHQDKDSTREATSRKTVPSSSVEMTPLVPSSAHVARLIWRGAGTPPSIPGVIWHIPTPPRDAPHTTRRAAAPPAATHTNTLGNGTESRKTAMPVPTARVEPPRLVRPLSTATTKTRPTAPPELTSREVEKPVVRQRRRCSDSCVGFCSVQ